MAAKKNFKPGDTCPRSGRYEIYRHNKATEDSHKIMRGKLFPHLQDGYTYVLVEPMPEWAGWHSFGLLLIIVAIAVFGLLIPAEQILLTWLLILVLLAVFTMIAGHGITGRLWFGWLINEQYRMSLSRLQMGLWTIVVLSAFLAAALANIRAGHLDKALAIAIPQQVWIAMGISTTSLVGSPLILMGKKRQTTNEVELARSLKTSVSLLSPEDRKTVVGNLAQNTKPADARLYDLVSGEEIRNRDVLDLSRLQNLFFTLILVGSYAALLGSRLASAVATITGSPIDSFPPLDESAIVLLGISHAGYLGSKAVDKQPEQPGG